MRWKRAVSRASATAPSTTSSPTSAPGAPLDLIISADADEDLAAIFNWSADQFGEDVATEYLKAIDAALTILRDYPRAGRLHPLTKDPVRVYECRSHRIFYDADDGSITVVRVMHKAQSVEKQFWAKPLRLI